MKTVRMLGAISGAIIALCALSAQGAMAAPKWLLAGKEITAATHLVTEGKFLLLGLSLKPTVSTHIVCNGTLLGTGGPVGAGLVEKVFGLKGESEKRVNCEVLHSELGECTGSLLALLEAKNLPWKTELLLPAGTTEIVDHFLAEPNGGNPAFLLLCTGAFGVEVKMLCLSKSMLTKALVNRTEGVFWTILNELSESCPLQDPVNAEVVSHFTAEGLVKELAGLVSVSD
jgi:hypothetical protein